MIHRFEVSPLCTPACPPWGEQGWPCVPRVSLCTPLYPLSQYRDAVAPHGNACSGGAGGGLYGPCIEKRGFGGERGNGSRKPVAVKLLIVSPLFLLGGVQNTAKAGYGAESLLPRPSPPPPSRLNPHETIIRRRPAEGWRDHARERKLRNEKI
jgi:hypothetical protein